VVKFGNSTAHTADFTLHTLEGHLEFYILFRLEKNSVSAQLLARTLLEQQKATIWLILCGYNSWFEK
jgi:hypothetical protein